MAMTNEEYDSDSCEIRMPLSRAEKRNRDSQIAKADYVTRQEKREEKRNMRMALKAAATQDESGAKMQKHPRRKSVPNMTDAVTSTQPVELRENSAPTPQIEEAKQVVVVSKHQRKLAKRRMRGNEASDDDELFAADAEAAAARRRAAWQAKEAAVEAARTKGDEIEARDAKTANEEEMLNALQAEAAKAAAAVVDMIPTSASRSRSRRGKLATQGTDNADASVPAPISADSPAQRTAACSRSPRKVKPDSAEAALLVAVEEVRRQKEEVTALRVDEVETVEEVFDAELEGWEIL
jgi:colicin import membrane protein